jgi:predicted nucleic acid-binding protein
VSLVIDSSMTLAWYFEDEKTDASLAVLNRVAESGAVVPVLWHLEVLNGLQVAVRRGRITAAYRDASLADLGALVIGVDPGTNEHAWSTTLRLCERAYDAAYLELAQRRQLPLATLDGRTTTDSLKISCCLAVPLTFAFTNVQWEAVPK